MILPVMYPAWKFVRTGGVVTLTEYGQLAAVQCIYIRLIKEYEDSKRLL